MQGTNERLAPSHAISVQQWGIIQFWVVILLQWRLHLLQRRGPEVVLVCLFHAINVFAWTNTQGTVVVSKVVTSKVEVDWPRSFEFEGMGFSL